MADIFEITPKFRKFILDTLLYKCLLKKSTVDFILQQEPNDGIMKKFRQAFIHKSLGKSNYDFYEIIGDKFLNASVMDYIRNQFPDIKSVGWLTKIYHNLISNLDLAKIAINNGFLEYIVYGDSMKKIIEEYKGDLQYSKDYMKMLGDTVEALCGIIFLLCGEYINRGVGYNACYNLVASYLDEITIPISFEEAWDAVSRLKEIFDDHGWNEKQGCRLKQSLFVFDIRKEMHLYKRFIHLIPQEELANHRFVALVFACIKDVPTFLTVQFAGAKKIAKNLAAEEAITILKNKYRIVRIRPDPTQL